ncbi:MAG: hypothetical protein ACLVHE_03245 [Dialister invisus]
MNQLYGLLIFSAFLTAALYYTGSADGSVPSEKHTRDAVASAGWITRSDRQQARRCRAGGAFPAPERNYAVSLIRTRGFIGMR